MQKHAERIGALLAEAGLHGALVASRQDDQSFGDAEAIYQVGSLLLRFVRDRGQDFLDIAAVNAPDQFHRFDDVEIATGLKTETQNPMEDRPEGIADTVARIASLVPVMETAFDGQHIAETVGKIAGVSESRGEGMRGILGRAVGAAQNPDK